MLAIQPRRQETAAHHGRRREGPVFKKCPVCGGTMRLHSRWGITGRAFVCGKCPCAVHI